MPTREEVLCSALAQVPGRVGQEARSSTERLVDVRRTSLTARTWATPAGEVLIAADEILRIFDVKGVANARVFFFLEARHFAFQEGGELFRSRARALWRAFDVQEDATTMGLGGGSVVSGRCLQSSSWSWERVLMQEPNSDAQREAPCADCDEDDDHAPSVHARSASVIQEAWRRSHRQEVGLVWWDKKQTRKVGSLLSHVLFLQYVLRQWSQGSRRGLGPVWVSKRHRCGGGANLATPADFEAQRERAEKMLQWYELYVTILKRLQDGITPMVLNSFCGGGGSSEGVRRAGGVSVGLDSEPQADYARKFGEQTFVRGDATSWALLADLQKRFKFLGALASPPCQWYSRARGKSETTSLPLIPLTRDVLRSLFSHWAMENVMGARPHMSESSVELFGQCFGRQVDRARLIESSFPVWLDECVKRPGLELRYRTCLGQRRRWRRLDAFGRPEPVCCQGNIFAVQGKAPWRCTADECSSAMGMDRDHMSFERLAQSLPPDYIRLVFAQMCMSAVSEQYGVPFISYDEHERDPILAKKRLQGWLIGAGDDRPEAGMSFQGRLPSMESSKGAEVKSSHGGYSPPPDVRRTHAAASRAARADENEPNEVMAGQEGLQAQEMRSQQAAEPSVRESHFREIFYSHAGGFDQQCGMSDELWLQQLKPSRSLSFGEISQENLAGKNTFFSLSTRAAKRYVPVILEAISGAGRGTRVSIELPSKHEHWLRRLGGQRLVATSYADQESTVVISWGRRSSGTKESHLDHNRCRAYMDPRDLGTTTRAQGDKRASTWAPMLWEPTFWEGKGLPPEVEEIMSKGATIEFEKALAAGAIPQYPFMSGEARYEASIETDRAVAAGHM